MRFKRQFVFCLLGLVIAVAPRGKLAAQIQYSPEHHEVQDMIQKALRFLEAQQFNGLGEHVISALAAYKASIYLVNSPKEHPVVQNGVKFVIDHMHRENAWAGGPEFTTLYVPALAAILLMEVDSERYGQEIRQLLDLIEDRQQSSGAWGYLIHPDSGDCSQMQYVALALWLAEQRGFKVSQESGRAALDWLVSTQTEEGGWIYLNPPIRKTGIAADTELRASICAASLGSVYIFSDYLNLNAKKVNPQRLRDRSEEELELELKLPPSVTEFNENEVAEAAVTAKVRFDVGKLQQCMNRGNGWFRSNFSPNPPKWTFYYLYAFERYASMRELIEGGSLPGFADWYDQGVNYLKRVQNGDGSFPVPAAATVDRQVTTCFAILFLTRSMALSLAATVDGVLVGGEGFKPDTLLRNRYGEIISARVEKDLSELLTLLDDPTDDQLDVFADELTELTLRGDGQSRASDLAKIRMLVTHQKYQFRLAAVRFLAKERDLASVPALIHAVTDPDPAVSHAAHDGLRFVSRRIDAPSLSAEPNDAEREKMRQYWATWYLGLRPDAELFDGYSPQKPEK